jgi:DNA-binding NtrC family response regulator
VQLQYLTILIVSSDTALQESLASLLTGGNEASFSLLFEKEPAAASHRCTETDAIDAVIVVGKDGLATASALRSAEISVPVVLVCEKEDFNIAVEALRLEIYDYLILDQNGREHLAHTLRNAVNRSRNRTKIAQAEHTQLLTEKKQEAISELIVTICHEFNNPLAAIKISTDIISREDVREKDRIILQEISRAIQSIEKKVIRLRDLNTSSQ